MSAPKWIGVRMALGAGPGSVPWMILREGLLLVLAGIAIGAPAALVVARLIASRLSVAGSADPLSVAGAASLMILVAALAAFVPAQRASRVDPMVALRCE